MPENKQQPPQPQEAPIAHPAATVILLREGKRQMEVLLVLRAKAIQFAGGAWVFPGGRVDPSDYEGCEDNPLLVAKKAASRESLEEVNLQLDPDEFHYFSHWTTPLAERKRFSTWFLLGVLPEGEAVVVDDHEIVDHLWLTPEEAIKRHHQGALKILPPTYKTLMELSEHDSIASALRAMKDHQPSSYFPNLVRGDNSVSILFEEDDGYQKSILEHDGKKHRMTLTKTGWLYID